MTTAPRIEQPAGDTDTPNRPHRLSNSDLTRHRLGVLGTVRTEVQVRPHTGFATGEIAQRDPLRLVSNGDRTPLRAKPPHWTETPGLPCVPLDPLGRKSWEVHWDTPRQVSEEKADELAADMCRSCPVQRQCLDDALRDEVDSVRGTPLHHSSRFMVRGGLTPKGRWRLAGDREQLTPKGVVTTGYPS